MRFALNPSGQTCTHIEGEDMARTWSVRLVGIALRAGAAKAALQEQIDRAFLSLAVLAHLCISVLGLVTLAIRATYAEHLGSALLEPSVVLFLLAGGSTALLLLHMSRSMAVCHPDLETAHHHRRVIAAFTGSGIPMPIPCPATFAAPLDEPAFSGLMDSVGHELRTPLNAIIGFSEMMQRELLGPLGSPRYQDYVRHIRDSGLAVLKAAEDTIVLTSLLADRQRVRSEAVDLDTALDEACRNPEARQRGIRIVRGAPCSATVKAEPAALRQSLSNLVAAAVLRAPPKRPISITTRVVDDSVRLCVTFAGSEPGADTCGAATRQSIAVARMLFELQGISLAERRCRDGAWRMTVALPVAETKPLTAIANARMLRRAARMRSLTA
jgi:signal transduction histidine kinase